MKTLREVRSAALAVAPGHYVYSIERLRLDSQNVFVALSSDDSLTYFSADTTAMNVLVKKTNFHDGVTCMLRYVEHPEQDDMLLTAGRDGVVKCWQGTDLTSVKVLNTANNEAISALACQPTLSIVAAGTDTPAENAGDVVVYLWNFESDGTSACQAYREIHSSSITAMFFHPSSTKQLVTGSTDSLINILQTNIPDEDDAIIATLTHAAPLHNIIPGYVSHPKTTAIDYGVFALSHDERLSCYAYDREGLEEREKSRINVKEQMKADYAFLEKNGNFNGAWLCAGANKLETAEVPHMTLAMLSARDDDSPDPHPIWKLEGAHGEEVVRDVWWEDAVVTTRNSPDMPMLTAGEDGYVRMWKEVQEDKNGHIGQAKRTGKESRGSLSESKRFKPY